MATYRARQAWHIYDDLPSANDYGIDFDNVIDSHYRSGHSDAPVTQILDLSEQHGMPRARELADDIIQANLETELARAGESGDFGDVFEAVNRGAQCEDYEDALEMATDIFEGNDDPEMLAEILEAIDDLINPTRRSMVDLARQFSTCTPLEIWRKIRRRCLGTPHRDWFRDVMDAHFKRKIGRREWRKSR